MSRPTLFLLAVGLSLPLVSLTAQDEQAPQLNVHRLIEVEFPTLPDILYQVQFSSSGLAEADWEDVGAPILGNGEPLHVGARQNDRIGFFRVRSIDPDDEEDGSIIGGVLGLPNGIPGLGGNDGIPAPPIISILEEAGGSDEEEPAETSEGWVRFVKVREGQPIGPLMVEGEGTLFAARKQAEGPNAGYEVRQVRVILED